jgi:hypothetical protein
MVTSPEAGKGFQERMNPAVSRGSNRMGSNRPVGWLIDKSITPQALKKRETHAFFNHRSRFP